MLYQRYNNPDSLLEKMISMHRLYEFVAEFMKIRSEELEEKTMWEFWLHKIYNMTFKEFVDSVQPKDKEIEATVSDEQLKNAVDASKEILDGFCLS